MPSIILRTLFIVVVGISMLVTSVYGLSAMPWYHAVWVLAIWGIGTTAIVYGIIKDNSEAKKKKVVDWFNI